MVTIKSLISPHSQMQVMQIGKLKPWIYDFGLLAHGSASQLFPQQNNNLAPFPQYL